MRKQFEPTNDSRQPTKNDSDEQPRRPYRTPQLTTYGNLRELALAKGGAKGDGGGVPPSKT
jgi:hypothetical protein